MSDVDKDNRILAEFIQTFCNKKHRNLSKLHWEYSNDLEVDLGLEPPLLCEDCSNLLSYSVARRIHCPQDPKPSCKNCEIHCYTPECRSRIKEVMRFSGKYLILQGRFDLILHYLF